MDHSRDTTYDGMDLDMVVKVLQQTAFSPWCLFGHAIRILTRLQALFSRSLLLYSTFFLLGGY